MHYFDTSALVPLILEEPSSEAISRYARALPVGSLATSLWGKTEVASVLAREVRMGAYSSAQGHAIWSGFETLLAQSFEIFVPEADDFALASAMVLDFATGLRAGDALHLAIAKNRALDHLLAFDLKLLKAARKLGVPASTGVRLA